ncbi:hypothetical protein D3C76_1373440 [compost metagenome]
MSQEKTVLLLIKGHISELTPEQQATVRQIHDQLKLVIDGSAESLIALSLLGAELSLEQA